MKRPTLKQLATLVLVAIVGVGLAATPGEAKKKKKNEKEIAKLIYETPPQVNYTSHWKM
ncbi:MAG: hypothetical protein ACKVJG_24205 [Candidatus Latescibacterota bacterium]|jgi:hypothetical protein